MKENRDLLSENTLLEYWNKGGFCLCVEGTAEVSINERYHHVERGVLYVVSPLVQIYDVQPSSDYQVITMMDKLDVFYPVFHLICDISLPLRIREQPCLKLTEEEIRYVMKQKERIDKKRACCEQATLPKERVLLSLQVHLIEQELLLEIVNIYYSKHSHSVEAINKRDLTAYNFLLSLHAHYHQQRSVSFYATEANLSTGHFTTIVKEVTGRVPSDWIATITIINAKILLEKSGKSIKEIAAELNFPEQFTFRKYFKQYVGVPPTEYRTMKRNQKL